MDGRKYQRKSGIKRTLVMLLALVMLASVCFPAVRVNAEGTPDVTVTEGSTESYSVKGLAADADVAVTVPDNSDLAVTYDNGVFTVNAASAKAGTYTVDYAYLDAEGADQSASFTVTVAEAENDNTPQQPEQPEQPQQQSEQSEQPQQQPEQSKDVVPVEGERSAKAKEFDDKIATLTKQVNSFAGTLVEYTALEAAIGQLKEDINASNASSELAEGEGAGLLTQADDLLKTLAPKKPEEEQDPEDEELSAVDKLFNRLMTASGAEELNEMMDELTEDECALLAQFSDEQARAVNAKLGLESALPTYDTTYATNVLTIEQGDKGEKRISNAYLYTYTVKLLNGDDASDAGITISIIGFNTVEVRAGEDTPTGLYTIECRSKWYPFKYSFTVDVKEKASGGSTGTDAFFFVRKDGNIQVEPADYKNEYYTAVPAGSTGSWTEIKNALKEAKAIRNDLEAVERNILIEPTEKQLKAALGDKFDENNDYVVWYVVKWADGEHNGNHLDGAWHVDGVVRHNPFLHYNANGGDTGTVPDSEQHKAGTDVTIVFENTRLNKVPTRDGYIFLGWAENKDATEPYYTESGTETLTMPDRDITLYAVWKKENLSSGSGTLNITGEKCWDDNENANQLRPDSITIQLQGSLDGTKWDDLGDPQTVQANPEGKWTYSFDASAYAYTQFRVREINVPDKYKVTYEDPQVKFTYPAAGGWGNPVTECSTIRFDTNTSKTTIIVAKKGGSYVVWTYYPLTPGEQSLILESLEGLQGENVRDSNCTFFYGIGAHSNGMTITESEITFDGKSSWSYYYSGTYTPATASATTSTITNTLSTATVTITKQVKGNMGDPNKSFPFTVTLTDGTMTGGTYPAADGSVAYTVTDNGTKVSFSLTGGQQVVLKDVPLNAKLTVTETNADAYEVKIDGVKVKDKGQEGSASKSDITVTEGKTITVENRNEATIDTGIVTDSIPYILLLTMAVIGAGVLLLNKRRVF